MASSSGTRFGERARAVGYNSPDDDAFSLFHQSADTTGPLSIFVLSIVGPILVWFFAGGIVVRRDKVRRCRPASRYAILAIAMGAAIWAGNEVRGAYAEHRRSDDQLQSDQKKLREANLGLQMQYDRLFSHVQNLTAQQETVRKQHGELEIRTLELNRQSSVYQAFLLAFGNELRDQQRLTEALNEQDARALARLNDIDGRFEHDRQIVEERLRFDREVIKSLAPPGLLEERGGVTLLRRSSTRPAAQQALPRGIGESVGDREHGGRSQVGIGSGSPSGN